MANDKVMSLLGLARRAGKLEAGFDATVSAARKGAARLLLAASDVSEKTYKNLEYEAKRAEIPAVRLKAGMEETGRACGVRAGVLAVTDQGFARALLNTAEQMERKKEERTL